MPDSPVLAYGPLKSLHKQVGYHQTWGDVCHLLHAETIKSSNNTLR